MQVTRHYARREISLTMTEAQATLVASVLLTHGLHTRAAAGILEDHKRDASATRDEAVQATAIGTALREVLDPVGGN
jgi:hypothetical protein